jgi:hypothetical protein
MRAALREVVADGGENSVGASPCIPSRAAVHAMLDLGVADDGLDRRAFAGSYGEIMGVTGSKGGALSKPRSCDLRPFS